MIVNRLYSNVSSLFVVSHVLSNKVSPEWRLNLGFGTLEELPGCQRLFAVDRPAAHTEASRCMREYNLWYPIVSKIAYNSENKPRAGFYFSKALFEGLIFGGAYIRRGLSTQGILRFKTDWASLIVGSKFTIFALFYFIFEGNFPSTSPQGVNIWRGNLTEAFLRYLFTFWRVLYLAGGGGGELFSEFLQDLHFVGCEKEEEEE